jgi:hypothetical protein
MPIEIGKRTFLHFRQAARYIARKKRWSIKRASAYVAVIERNENKPKRARWRGKA